MIQLPQSHAGQASKDLPKTTGKDLRINEKKVVDKTFEGKPNTSEDVNEFQNELNKELENKTENPKSEEVAIKQFDQQMTNEIGKLISPEDSLQILQQKVISGEDSNKISQETKTNEIQNILKNNPLVEKQNSIFLENQIYQQPIEEQDILVLDQKSQKPLVLTEEKLSFVNNDQVFSDNLLVSKGNNLKTIEFLNESPKINQELSSVIDQMVPEETTDQIFQNTLNEDFLSQKNLTTKKGFTNPYGIKGPLFGDKKVVGDRARDEIEMGEKIKNIESNSVNSQQFILGIKTEGNASDVSPVNSPSKVFDMSKIKTSDTNQIMNQITDYIVQAKSSKGPMVNMRINHDELGLIDLSVSKLGINQDSIIVNIGTHTLDGKSFFQQNSKDLFSHLTNAGINVADLKVEVSQKSSGNEFDSSSQNGRNSSEGGQKQFGSEQNQRRHDSERRQDLWKLLNKEAA